MAPARPFLKWAGGKTQLIPTLLEILPARNAIYFEPFIGGGAVFFALVAQGGRFQRAVLNDWNKELADCYRAIRDFPDEVIEQLKLLPYSKKVFLELRAKMPQDFSPCRRAARMIYLNKTGFNGLYRVNKAGGFNVPFGKFKSPPKILDEDNIHACAKVLNRRVSLFDGDFVPAVETAQSGDAVYFDPPYVPVNTTANFTSYTSDGFTIDDQHRLAASFRQLVGKGVAVVASNSDTDVVRELYKGFEIREIQARRSINSKGDKRGSVGELIIVGRSA